MNPRGNSERGGLASHAELKPTAAFGCDRAQITGAAAWIAHPAARFDLASASVCDALDRVDAIVVDTLLRAL